MSEIGVASAVLRSSYHDSVSLMRVAARLSARAGVTASLMMGTPANKDLLRDAGLLDTEADGAGPNDLVIAVSGPVDNLAGLLAEAAAHLEEQAPPDRGAAGPDEPRTLFQAVRSDPGLNLALISVPGRYAAAEALKALRLGLHVFMFSDNVDIASEVMLKEEATRQGCIMMGPDCGTALLGGVPLGFVNEMHRGSIGLVGASGTGLQQVGCLIDRAGGGVSQVIGVGSRDLSAEVIGRSTRAALEALGADPQTEVIVLVCKPPEPAVAAGVLQVAAGLGKPVVATFLGASVEGPPGVAIAACLDDAAMLALESVGFGGRFPAQPTPAVPTLEAGRGRFVRCLYSGGSFAYEARQMLSGLPGGVRSHLALPTGEDRPVLPSCHLVADLGDDIFTVGRPHPMIDSTVRVQCLRAALADPSTALVVLDVVLGHGSAPDPAGPLVEVLEEAGERPPVVGFVCGTEGDPQALATQEAALEKAGVLLARSSSVAARMARTMLERLP